YRVARDEAARDERQLVGLAALDDVDLGPLRTAADGWEVWADGAVSLTPAAASASQIERGDRLFSTFQARERRLDRIFDGAATQAATQADLRSGFLATVTPAIGLLLLGLLLFLSRLVIGSMLR